MLPIHGTFIIFAMFSVKGVNCVAEYFVSSEIGVDQFDCGTITKQCRTIHFAYHRIRQQQGEEDVRIMLDGGMKNSLIYTLTSPLFIVNRLELWKNENTLHNPVLKANYHDAYAFSSASKDTNNALMVSSVDFNNLKIFQALHKTNSKITITIHNSTTMFSSFHMPNNTPLINIKSNNEVSLNLSQSSFFSYAEVLSIKSSRRSLININVQGCNFQNSGILQIHKIISEITTPTDNLNKSLNTRNASYTQNQIKENEADKVKITNCKFQGRFFNSMQLKHSFISIDTNFDLHSTFDVEISNVYFYNFHLPSNGVIRLSNTSSVTLKNVIITRLYAKEIINISRSTRVHVSGLYVKESVLYTNMLSLHKCTHIDFNMLSISNNTYESSGFHFLQCSNVTINNITVERNLCGSTNQNVTFWSATAVRNFTVNNLNLFKNTFSITMISFIKSNVVIFNNIHDARNVFKVDIFFMNSVDNNEIHNIISQHSTIGSTFIYLVNSKWVNLNDIRIYNLTSNKHFIMAEYINEFTVQRVEVYESKIEENIIFFDRCHNLRIQNMNVTSNTLKGRVVMVWFSYLTMDNIYISQNRYLTGVSMTNCNASISNMKIILNNATGSTRDFYYHEFKDDNKTAKFIRQKLCWGFLVRRLTLINVTITTRSDTLDSEKRYAVTFVLIVAKFTMKNFLLNLEKFQNNGFEMILNNREFRYINPDWNLNCPVGTFAIQEYDNTEGITYNYKNGCKPCGPGYYLTEGGRIHVTKFTTILLFRDQNLHDPVIREKFGLYEFLGTTKNPECKPCSVGGVCRHGLSKSRGNFHGYIDDKTKDVIYISCPLHYCCTSRDGVNCTSYNTCYKRREGALCGNCQAGYQENMFNSFCIPTNMCTRKSEFWVLYVVTVFIVLLVICFIDQMGPALKKLLSLLRKKKILRKRKQRKWHLNNTSINERDNFRMADSFQLSEFKQSEINTEIKKKNSTTTLGHNSIESQTTAPITETITPIGKINDGYIHEDTTFQTSDEKVQHQEEEENEHGKQPKHYQEEQHQQLQEEQNEFKIDNDQQALSFQNAMNNITNMNGESNQISQNSTEIQDQTSIKSFKTENSSIENKSVSFESLSEESCELTSGKKDGNEQDMIINNGKQYTIGGVFQAFVAFYQVRSLMNVESIRKNAFTEFMSDVFNGGLFFNFIATFCPYENIGVPDKMFIRYGGISIVMLSMLLIMAIVHYIYKKLYPTVTVIQVKESYKYTGDTGSTNIDESEANVSTAVTASETSSTTIHKNSLDDTTTSGVTSSQTSVPSGNLSTDISPTEETTIKLPEAKKDSPRSLSLKHRLEVCYSKILLFNFKNLAFFCFLAIHCVLINGIRVWYSNGNIQCLQSWQYGAILFLVLWVVPFPVALAVSFHLYQHEKITYHEKMICMTFPMATIWFFIRNGEKVKTDRLQLEFVKQMYVEPYRLSHGKTDKYIFWEHWRLIQRLILSTLSVFFTHPIFKITLMVPCIIFFTVVYIFVQPFKKQFTLLHWLEVSSLMGYFVIIAYNLFKAFLFVYDVTDTSQMDLLIRVFMLFEIAFSPLVICILFMVWSYVHGRFTGEKKQKDE